MCVFSFRSVCWIWVVHQWCLLIMLSRYYQDVLVTQVAEREPCWKVFCVVCFYLQWPYFRQVTLPNSIGSYYTFSCYLIQQFGLNKPSFSLYQFQLSCSITSSISSLIWTSLPGLEPALQYRFLFVSTGLFCIFNKPSGIFLDCWRKREHLDESHVNRGRTFKLHI